MASAQSSQDMWRGRSRQPRTLGNAQPRHRSESRCLSERRRPVKIAAPERDHCPGALHEGDAVRVFSRSADKWVDGEVVKFLEGNFLRVEYEADEYWCGKILHLHSDHLTIPADSSDFEEVDPGAPVMQGNHAEEPVDAASLYLSFAFLLAMLKRGDVVLVKGSWLYECYSKGWILPRRQELPCEAIWNPDELEERIGKDVLLISISHCWYSKDHPDPDGQQLQDVGEALWSCMNNNKCYGITISELAIFWCWCSYYQEPRTSEQQVAFDRSLNYMDVWYSNVHTDVWMLTKVPPNVPNNRGYFERGWTTWESTVAYWFQKGHHRGHAAHWQVNSEPRLRSLPLDLGRKGWQGSWNWQRIVKTCGRDALSLQLDPQEFAALIEKKTFTKGSQDCDLVKSNYQKTFKEAMSVVDFMIYYNSGPKLIDDRTIGRLACSILPFCKQLRVLDIPGKQFGVLGLIELIRVLHLCERLQFLNLGRGSNIDEKNPMLRECISQLAKTLPVMRSMKTMIIKWDMLSCDLALLKCACSAQGIEMNPCETGIRNVYKKLHP